MQLLYNYFITALYKMDGDISNNINVIEESSRYFLMDLMDILMELYIFIHIWRIQETHTIRLIEL